MFRLTVFLCLFSAWATPLAEQVTTHLVEGYVTRISSPTTLDLSDRHIVITPQTRRAGKATDPSTANPAITIGDFLSITGTLDIEHDTVIAQKNSVKKWTDRQVKGFAVIDKVVATSPERIVRADGYRILLTPKTTLTFSDPVKTLADVTTNLWINYSGTLRNDGVVVADSAVFTPDTVSDGERKFREIFDKKVAAKPGQAQDRVGKIRLSPDPKAQERVERIGRSLVPAYQQRLPESDPTRIDFRFYLIDDKSVHTSYSYPGGEIFVPVQVVDRLKNDDQLAAVLAAPIAEVMEKQVYRVLRPTNYGLLAADAAAVAGGIFVPGLSFASVAAGYGGQAILTKLQEQSDRVGLSLMTDAGYDVLQAPAAWQLLLSPFPELAPCDRSAYLLQTIGREYRQTGPELFIGPRSISGGE